MSATARERAASFAREHGDPLARARADALMGRAEAAAVLARVAEPDPSDLAGLERVLSVCEELHALRDPLARRCAEALEALQQQDGGFGEPRLALEQRLQLTGTVAGGLARFPFVRLETLDAAGSYLAAHFTPERLQGFRLDNLAAYARYFACAPHEASDAVLQWCGRELERGFRARAFDAVQTAHVLVLCDAHALPGARIGTEELLVGLLTEQASDGSFGAAPAPEDRVAPTLRGLRALAFLDRAPGAR